MKKKSTLRQKQNVNKCAIYVLLMAISIHFLQNFARNTFYPLHKRMHLLHWFSWTWTIFCTTNAFSSIRCSVFSVVVEFLFCCSAHTKYIILKYLMLASRFPSRSLNQLYKPIQQFIQDKVNGACNCFEINKINLIEHTHIKLYTHITVK